LFQLALFFVVPAVQRLGAPKVRRQRDQCQRPGHCRHCAAGDTAEQGTVWLKESDGETSGKVGCWFSNQQAVEFSKSAAASIQPSGSFNGEAGVDLKFCRVVKVE
jgi:hypothetical protein